MMTDTTAVTAQPRIIARHVTKTQICAVCGSELKQTWTIQSAEGPSKAVFDSILDWLSVPIDCEFCANLKGGDDVA
jgi:hypothetical protein